MKKYLILALLPVAIVSILFEVYIDKQYPSKILCEKAMIVPTVTPTPAPWQIYHNDQYGFEFQYPYRDSFFPGVTVAETKLSYLDTLKQYNSGTFPKPPVCKKDKNGSLCTVVADVVKESFHNINGIEINRLTITGDESDLTYLYFTSQNKHYLVDLGLFMEDDDLISKIVSTFKFLTDTSTWKTYRNDLYGFEFKYPNDFLPGKFEGIQDKTDLLFSYLETPDYKHYPNYIGEGDPYRDGYGLTFRLKKDSCEPVSQNTAGIYDVKTLTLGKYPAQKYTVSWEVINSQILNINLRDNCLTLSLDPGESKIPTNKQLFDQILSTIKFTK